MLSVVMLSLSAAFASDNATDVAAIDNEIVIDEPLAVEEDSQAVSANENVVTKDNFNNYFDSTGSLLSNVTSDELIFSGDISNVGVDNIVLNRSIKISGNDAVLTNISIDVKSSDVVISGLTINQDKGEFGISVSNASDVLIEDSTINFNANAGINGYAINADFADNLKIMNNIINYVGATTGWEVNYAIRVSNSNNTIISGNKIKAKIVSADVGWAEIPPGSGNWVSSPISGTIAVRDSNGSVLDSNDINTTYSGVVTSYGYDTIYVVDFSGTSGTVIVNNNITSVGKDYIYGIIISDNDFTIRANNIKSTGEYYANGIDIEGPAAGVVEDNVIEVKSGRSAYGIYSGMNGADVSANYTGNEISGEAYNIFAFSIGDVSSNVINNTVLINGNYTTGMAYRGVSLSASGNKFVLNSSEVGNESIWEGFGVEAVGIKVIKGTANIADNVIAGPGKGVSVKGNETNVVLKNNMINTVANVDKNAYAIYANDTASLKIVDNHIDYQGTTKGTGVNNAIYLYNADGAIVNGNKFDLDLVSADVAWIEVPVGSGNWISAPISEGIVVEDSDNVSFDSNTVSTNFTDVITSYGYDTIYSVDFKNSNNAVITNNEITSVGKDYIYGIILSGNDFTIRANNITSIGEYYANGIDIEGPATGIVENNGVLVISGTSAYGIYSGMNGADVSANYSGNEISGNAYNIFGMSVGDVDSNIVNNFINLKGNYTTGIAYRGSKLTIADNNVVLESSEVGNESIWEGFGVEAVGIKVIKGNVNINNNIIAGPGKGVSILNNVTEASLTGNFINTVANVDKNAYAIYAVDAAGLIVSNNTVDYQGATNGTGINNAVYINDVEGAVIDSNKFDLDLVSSYVPWAEVPSGSGNWVSSPISEGIVVESSNNVTFDNNTVNVQYTDVVGNYDTIYSVDFKNSNNAVISNNDIISNGNTYIYGIIITGDNFNINSNDINTTSNYYSNGIDIEGPATGVVKDNGISVKSPTSAYGIYSGMNGANVSAAYLGNDITGDAYNIFGFSLGDVESNVTGNNVVLAGNYTTGIAYRGSNLVVDNNIISAKGSNVGNESIWEGFGVQNIGIKVVKGVSTITNNNIQTTGDSAINLTNNDATVKDNYLASAKGVGDNAIVEVANATITSNAPEYKIILASPRVYTEYADGVLYVVMAYDENGNPVSNITLFSTVNNVTYNATTDDEGYAAFVVDLNAGYYVAVTSFAGNEEYGPKDVSTPITVDASASAIKASSSVTVLLTKVKSGYNFKLTLVDMKGNGLANKKVSITFNGKTKTYTTNSLGVISYKLSATKTGSYKLTMKFAGDNNYVASSATSTIKLTKQATKLTAAKKTFKVKTKIKKYTVTLKDSKNKVIKKVKVTLKVKGKTYKATTNAKGKATFKITKLTKAGSYKATVKFAGNAYYKASTKSVKITVKK